MTDEMTLENALTQLFARMAAIEFLMAQNIAITISKEADQKSAMRQLWMRSKTAAQRIDKQLPGSSEFAMNTIDTILSSVETSAIQEE